MVSGVSLCARTAGVVAGDGHPRVAAEHHDVGAHLTASIGMVAHTSGCLLGEEAIDGLAGLDSRATFTRCRRIEVAVLLGQQLINAGLAAAGKLADEIGLRLCCGPFGFSIC